MGGTKLPNNVAEGGTQNNQIPSRKPFQVGIVT
jgi:hypothetical protein